MFKLSNNWLQFKKMIPSFRDVPMKNFLEEAAEVDKF